MANGFGDGEDNAIWNRYLKALEKSPVDAFGLTDHFSYGRYFDLVDQHMSLYPMSPKILLCNIEFRLAKSISKDGGLPHIHILFDNDPALCGREQLDRFLTDLGTQAVSDAKVRRRCIDLRTQGDFEAATVSLDDLEGALRSAFGNEKPYLIAFPANNDGLRSTNSNSPRKVQLADRIDKVSDLFFGNDGSRAFLLGTDRYKVGASEPKPVVSGSDAHSFDELERLSGDASGLPPTWIKGDLTFRGLTQICYEPGDRVFIGQEPPVLVRLREDGTKFLDGLMVDQVATYGAENGVWFKGVDIPLNPELTVIIGNKGSGKSAIVDILGLLGNSRQEAHFSFLTDDPKSKKFRQKGYAENFTAGVTWGTGKSVNKALNQNCELTEPEAVRYLPQHYFEELTNEIEIEKFRYEIEEVVFSHVDETDKLGKATFAELQEAKTLEIKQQVSLLKQRLRELNVEIARLEEDGSPRFRQQLRGQIEARNEELKALESAKPKEFAKPDEETDDQKELAAKVDGLSELLSSLKDAEKSNLDHSLRLKSRLQIASSLRERLGAVAAMVKESEATLKDGLNSFGLTFTDIIQFASDLEPLKSKIRKLNAEIQSC